MKKYTIRESGLFPGKMLPLLILCFLSLQILAQTPIGFLKVKGNTGTLNLRIISVANAIAAGNGVIKIVMDNGTVGAADLVATTHASASPVRVQTPYGVRSWRKETHFAFAYGGAGSDLSISLAKTSDGGFALGGYTNSWGEGLFDQLLIKTDANGNMTWAGTYGDIESESGQAVRQRTDNGYIIVGTATQEYSHMYVNFIGSAGNLELSAYFGPTNCNTAGYDVIQCSDGNFVAIGYADIYGEYGYEVYLKKFNINGDNIWGWISGSTSDEVGKAIVQRPDGGYIGVGYIWGDYDQNAMYCLINADGTVQTMYSIGGAGIDEAEAVTKAADDGYVFTGRTDSFGAGGWDIYLRKQSGDGSGVWSYTIGGTGSDFGNDILLTPDGGFAIAGGTDSYGAGGTDLWLIKTDSLSNVQWSWVFGGTGDESGYSVVQTSDGCYYVACVTNSYGAGGNDVLFVKFAPDGSACMGYSVGFNSDMMEVTENTDQFKAHRIDNFEITNALSDEKRIRVKSLKMKETVQIKLPGSRDFVTPTTTVICN